MIYSRESIGNLVYEISGYSSAWIRKYTPRIKTYRIQSITNNLKGVFIFSNEGVKGIFTIDNQTYQIDKFKMENYNSNSVYFLSNINDSPIDFDFSCDHDNLNHENEVIHENRIDGNNFGSSMDFTRCQFLQLQLLSL